MRAVSIKTVLTVGCAMGALTAMPTAAAAQDQTADEGTSVTSAPADQVTSPGQNAIIVTGSRIKQDPTKSSLPLQVITTKDLTREGINSPEQLISFLSTNGNGADNLASNSDVTSGAQRGTNGLSAANLRGQGASSTLVLLNGRRVAAHGLTGSAVDVNQIPFAALERVEVLKDGASALYGTDAVGGVINFITRTDFEGVDVTGFTDITQEGDSPIYRLSGTVGYGNLAEQGFNIMASVSKSWSGILRGSDRDFVNGNQPNRGLSVDTRGTPIATIMANGINGVFAPDGSLLSGADLTIPGTTINATGGINVLDLPGGAGCGSFDGGMAYDHELWANDSAYYACAWDTGRAAILQQPLETLTYYGRATVALGQHQLSFEVTGSDADSSKQFSSNQYAGNTSTTPLYYPLNPLTEDTYNAIYNQLVDVFPDIAQNYGKPIAYRWRCTVCGPREYKTNTKTFRAGAFIEGPIGGDWDYRAGGSYAQSEASSVLGSGYSYRGIFSSNDRATSSGVPGAVRGDPDPRAPTAPGATAPGIIGLLNSGIINPFSIYQTPEALAALKAVSADGTVLYGGKYDVWQFDASVSGSLFQLPAGAVKLAAGVDYRREAYSFNGSPEAELDQPEIFNVAFDNVNALKEAHRTVKAVYGELLIPVFDMLEVTAAGRLDDYSGFGTTFNPKFTAKFTPTDWLMFRGSYNTGFRVPNFNQIFNGVTESPNPGNTLVDPTTCPGGAVSSDPGCEAITPDTLTGGNLNLGPETSKQYSFGVVLTPSRHFSASVDYWSIAVDDTIGALTLQQLLDNIAYFPERVTRTDGIITQVDLRADNIGSRRTEGLEVSLRGGADVGGGVLSVGMDGTYLLKKKEKFLPSAPYGDSLIGVFTFSGDLGLKWKHNAWINYTKDNVSLNFSQIYRDGYENQALPGIANGSVTRPDYNERVKAYIVYNASVSVDVDERFRITAGVKNVFNTDPPFAITYDSNTGAGSSWEPRVADPRGRSFTMMAQMKF
ncbi:TonB-dependent receptor [Altererythrobacter sp. FM1]|uniref:TonB-dependent receptor domain-containing protein n=1 Tax=Tsuneonella flava TaxID=2055955 RepID=UPI000C80AB44|nr:TonB-dependent receptor [Tsuneonella flava]ROT97022.1 TonB-dependent receptor [Altererythrobacter sp. FM1]